ncbi:polyphosphate polymerase domain-containing protein [Labilibacter marinus]|uniref:polyphosphate polymerase domain-containing protein n=1 Tax=Labilibacter marinus TaxID=1477105 RepID=UPI00094F9921|nr:polyphosphate polymerase domain-containing protein [Labilibacter marinus]
MGELGLERFDIIHLDEMDQVKLMNRVDKKYYFHVSRLSDLLAAIQEDYFLLKVEEQNLLQYSTVYYDTSESKMFTAHHNGKLNRYKIRRRCYVSSGISFLEVKFKNNKGRTLKSRIPSSFQESQFSNQDKAFVQESTPFYHGELSPSLKNNFSRLTLVNKNFKERCTIDLNLHFQKDKHEVMLDKMAIVEVKSDGRSSTSPLLLSLRDQRIKPSGFSKYCIGKALTDADVKRNAFKARLRRVEKLLHTDII